MIKYNPKSWFQLIFAFHKSDTARILWKELIYIGVFSALLSWVELTYFPDNTTMEKLMGVYSLIGFVISLLLVFRTNTAYDRWWEGRKKWGQMVNDTRSLALKISVLPITNEERLFFSRMIGNFVVAMREHLRQGVHLKDLDLTDDERAYLHERNHIPLAIQQLVYSRLHALKSQGLISEENYLAIDTNLNEFMNSLGACERIRNTPIPYSYSLFLKKFIFIYTTTLPLALVTNFGYWATLITMFVFYILVSMEVLAEEIEDPFGVDDNDLPTNEISENIKRNIDEVLG